MTIVSLTHNLTRTQQESDIRPHFAFLSF